MPNSRIPICLASRPSKALASRMTGGLLFVLVLVFAVFREAPAANPVPPTKTIDVVLDDNYPPYIFRDADGKLQGILKDRWALWEASTGIRVNLRAMDWAKALETMKAGGADVIDTIFMTAARKAAYDFSAPYASLEVPIFFHKNIGGIVDAASLKGFAVGVKEGDACVDYLQERGIDRLEKFASYDSLVGAAAASKVRIFCIDKPPAEYILNKLGVADDFRFSAPLYVGQFHRAFRKGDDAVMKTVEDGFANIAETDLKAIDEKWRGSALPHSDEGWRAYARDTGIAVLVLLAVALALVIWKRALRRRVVANTADLTRTLSQLRTSEERWKFALDGARDAMWDYDVESGTEHVSARWPEMLGYTDGELDVSYNAWERSIHPDDRATVLSRLQACLGGSAAIYESEHRVRCKDGSWKWILVRGKVVARDADGKALRMIGTRSDITERIRGSEERNRLATIVKRSLTEIYLVDFDTLRFDYANDGALQNLGYSMDELRRMTPFDIKPGLSEDSLRALIEPLVAHEKEVVVFETQHRRADGSVYPVEVHWQLTVFEGHPVLLSLVLDTTDRRETEKLRTAKAAAELASHTKTIFLASMSHELRTPLNSILGFAQLLEYEPVVKATESAQKKVAHIRTAGKHLLAMVEDILDISGIEAGRLTLTIEPVEMLALLRECAAQVGMQALDSKINLNYVHEEQAYWVEGDRKRLRQILVNLLSNAIKYNRDSGTVDCILNNDNDCVTIAIQDTGAGLNAAQLDKLFEPFNRLGAENSAIEGTGIGLVIVKQLVLAMGGSINVVSKHGAGSTFTLTFIRSAQVAQISLTQSA